ncbi:MAG: sulfur carrier protein ThiS [Bacteroidota bacterium]
MTIKVNSDVITVDKDYSIMKLLNYLNIQSVKGTAVAVNNQVVVKEKWNDYILNENDTVLVIRATQGG